MDNASAYGAEDWGFESPRGFFSLYIYFFSCLVHFFSKIPVREWECTEKCLRSAQNEILTWKCCVGTFRKGFRILHLKCFWSDRKNIWRQISDVFGEFSDIFGFFRRIFSACLAKHQTPRRRVQPACGFFLDIFAQKLAEPNLAPRFASVSRFSGAWNSCVAV